MMSQTVNDLLQTNKQSKMAKPTQVLLLEPSVELTFKGPFTEVVTSYLHLYNPSDRIEYFKVKTTAPKFYCVRPNSGIMKPSTFESERKKHKVTIQTAFANKLDTPVKTFGKNADPQQVKGSKLRVHFVPGNETTSPSSSEAIMTDAKDTLSTPVKTPNFGQDRDLQNESELRRRAEKISTTISKILTKNLERENRELRERLEAIDKSAQQAGIEGMPIMTDAKDTLSTPVKTPNFGQDRDLQNESELRKRAEKISTNLERENRELRERLEAIAKSAQQAGIEGMPIIQVFLIALAALLVVLILGKLF